MKKVLIVMLVASVSLLANEPSAYGAGDLDSQNPYGLSSSEKNILQNKNNIKSLSSKLADLKLQFLKLKESYEGISSITEGYANKIAKIDAEISKLSKSSDNFNKEIEELKNESISLKSYIDENRKLQDTNQEKIKIVLDELSSIIDSINNNYVSKDKFAELEKKVDELFKKKKVEAKLNKSGAELLKEAVSLFKNKSYDESKELFTELVKRKYKPARSNYYLGEIAYFQKSYKTAIAHYKKSISLYDKAEYIPTLLYHTGISFSKLKENKQAKQFFDALKQGYPNSKEAKSLK